MTSGLLKKLDGTNLLFEVDEKFLQNFPYEKITIINKPIDNIFYSNLIREKIDGYLQTWSVSKKFIGKLYLIHLNAFELNCIIYRSI